MIRNVSFPSPINVGSHIKARKFDQPNPICTDLSSIINLRELNLVQINKKFMNFRINL